jgi:hypothetical protein
MPLDKQNFNYSIPLSASTLSSDNGVIVGDTTSSALILNGKILYSANGTTYIPVGISTVVSNSVAYQATAPSNPSVGQIWVDSSSNNTNYDPNLIRRKTIVATGGQTVFTADLAFTDGYEQVFVNGVLIPKNVDYTTSNSITVTLVKPSSVGDIVEILSITNLNSVGAAGALTTTNTFTGAQTFTPSSAAITPITINGAFNQTGDILNINNYSGANLFKINSSGNIRLNSESGAEGIYMYRSGGSANDLRFLTSQGSNSIPAAVTSTQLTGQIHFQAYDGTSYTDLAMIGGQVEGTVTAGSVPTALRFCAGVTSQIEYMRLNSAGTLDIKNSALPRLRLMENTTVGNPTIQLLDASNADAPTEGLEIKYESATGHSYIKNIYPGGNLYFQTAGANTKFLIGSDGNVLVGYTSSNGAYKLQVNSQIFATSTSIATSDVKFKKNVKEITGGLDIVDSLRPVQFDWKKNETHNFVEGKTVGFIAQEVREALKDYEWVGNLVKSNYNEENEEEFLGLAESNIIPLLVSAVKELRAEVKELRGIIK